MIILKYKKIAAVLLPSFLFAIPLFARSQGLIPCDGIVKQCDFEQFMILVDNVIRFFLFTIVTPFLAIVLAYIGWLYLSQGEKAKSKAKSMLWKLVIGYAVALGAWIIVRTIMVGLGYRSDIFNAFYE